MILKKRNYDLTGNPEGNPYMNSGMSGMPNGMDDIFSSIFGNNECNGININHGMPNVRIFRNGQPVFRGLKNLRYK